MATPEGFDKPPEKLAHKSRSFNMHIYALKGSEKSSFLNDSTE